LSSFRTDLLTLFFDAGTLFLDAYIALLVDLAAIHAEEHHQEPAADSGLAHDGPEKLCQECHACLFGQ
jgi:hypothetical protein